MSTGACIIDGVDIATLGMFIAKGGDNGFIVFPERVEPIYNDWPEENGYEVDLSDPVFNARKFTVQYYCKGLGNNFQSRINNFVDIHYQTGYRSVYVREFNKTFQLRFDGISGYRQNRGFSMPGEKSAFIDVDYYMDEPLQFFSAVSNPANGHPYLSHVKLNDTELSAYGIIVRDVYSTAMRSKPKTPLIIESKYVTGLVADVDAPPVKEIKKITIECTLLAGSVSAFWTNYNALWGAVSSGGIGLELTAYGKALDCWYTGMTRFDKKRAFSQRVRVDFDLELIAYSEQSVVPQTAFVNPDTNEAFVDPATGEYIIDPGL